MPRVSTHTSGVVCPLVVNVQSSTVFALLRSARELKGMSARSKSPLGGRTTVSVSGSVISRKRKSSRIVCASPEPTSWFSTNVYGPASTPRTRNR